MLFLPFFLPVAVAAGVAMVRNQDVLEDAASAERAALAARDICSERLISAEEAARAEKAKLDGAFTRLRAASGNKDAIGVYATSFADLIVFINTNGIKFSSQRFHR
jgi:hypothetical protein